MKIIKQPSEDRLYDLPMGLGAGRAVAAVNAIIVTAKGLVAETSPLSAIASAFSGGVVQLRISGGTDGEVYLITATVLDDAGDLVEADAELHVMDLDFVSPSDGSVVTYIEPSQYLARFGLAETLALTDEAGVGKIGRAIFYAALADAAAEIDAYLGARSQTPFAAPIPGVIERIAGDIARARLHSAGAVPDAVAGALTDARRTLRDLADGRAYLIAAATVNSETRTGAPKSSVGTNRPFSDGALSGFNSPLDAFRECE
jgi:phage gp36-like protein